MAKRVPSGRVGKNKNTTKRAARTPPRAKRSAPQRSSGARSKSTARKQKATQAASASARKKTAARAAASRSNRKKSVTQPSRLASAATAARGAVAGAVAAVTNRLPWSSNAEDAITLLETDHRRFEDLLKRGEETTERAVKGRTDLLRTLTAELHLHELVEEKILYPALKAHPEARDIVLEGYEEHHVADVLTRELHDLPTDDEKWGAKFKVLKESLEHHIAEEESDMFRRARGIFSRKDLQQLGATMVKMKSASRT